MQTVHCSQGRVANLIPELSHELLRISLLAGQGEEKAYCRVLGFRLSANTVGAQVAQALKGVTSVSMCFNVLHPHKMTGVGGNMLAARRGPQRLGCGLAGTWAALKARVCLSEGGKECLLQKDSLGGNTCYKSLLFHTDRSFPLTSGVLDEGRPTFGKQTVLKMSRHLPPSKLFPSTL